LVFIPYNISNLVDCHNEGTRFTVCSPSQTTTSIYRKIYRLSRVGITCLFFGAITYLKWWPQVGLKGLDNKRVEIFLGVELRYLRFLWLPVLFLFIHILLVLFAGLPPTLVLMFVLINTLMVGICEELMFRGILFHGASSSFGIWRAVWITTIIFGAIHVLSGFVSGDFNTSILQAFYAFMFGFYMVALRIRLDTIIPGIIIHWLWDYLIDLTHFNGYSGVWVESILFYIAFSRTAYGYFETIYLKDTMIDRKQNISKNTLIAAYVREKIKSFVTHYFLQPDQT